MQIMPTSYNDYNINQTSIALAGSDYTPSYSTSDFSQSLNSAMSASDESYYAEKSYANQRSEAEEQERAEERRRNMRSENQSFDVNDHLDSPYTGMEKYSDFVQDPVRFTPTELNSLSEALMKDGASVDAINAVKAMANKVGGVTAEQVTSAVEDALCGTRNNLSAEETTSLQNFCNRLDPNDPDKLYSDIRYSTGTKGIEAVEKAFGEMQGTAMATMTAEELTAIGRALNLSSGSIDGLQKKLEELNTSGASRVNLSQKDVESILGNAEAEIQNQATTYAKTVESLEKNLADTVKTAEARETAALEAQSREDKTVTQKRMIMEDTSTTRALGESLNLNARGKEAKEAQTFEARMQDEKQEKAQEALASNKQEANRVVKTEQDSIASNLQNVTTVKKTLETNESLFEKSQQELEWNDKEFLELQNENLGNILGTNRDANATGFGNAFGDSTDSGARGFNNAQTSASASGSSSASSIADAAKFEFAFASASQSHYLTSGLSSSQSSSSQSIRAIDASLSRYAADVRDQVQSSISNSLTGSMMSMGTDGTKTIEVSLNPVELGQLNIALSIRNGEVNATIEAEKAESASMINAQMAAIKQELENQGFKITNIEVEVGLSQDNFADNRQDWQGAEYQNSNQTQSEQQQFLEQLQILNKLSAIDKAFETGNELTLARNMQDKVHMNIQTANSAVEGVHITV